jgi:hypothetical protein
MGFASFKVVVSSSKNLFELLERVKKNDFELGGKISSAKVGKHINIKELSNEETMKKVILIAGETVIFYSSMQEFSVDVFPDMV